MPGERDKIQRWKTEYKIDDGIPMRSDFLHVAIRYPLFNICRLHVLFKTLLVFTPYSHQDTDSIMMAHESTGGIISVLDTAFSELLLSKAFEMCDTFQRLWDEQKTCDKHGFLTKRGGNIKSWKIRYFTLRGYELKYYDEPVATKCISSLDLSSCTKVF